MSKFLKFIVHLAIIGTLLCVLALVLPPRFGIKTTIIDGSFTDTNMLYGSVTYSKQIDPADLKLGDDIVVQNGKSVRRYDVIQVNLTDQTCMVKDPTFAGDYSQTISTKGGVYKTLLPVEYIGYLLIATQSREGWIVIGVAILVLIILYIIAELWKKNPSDRDDYEEYEDFDEIEVKSKKELRKEEKERAARRKQEEKEISVNEKKRKKKKSSTIRTGGFIDEISEEDENIEEELRDIDVMEKEAPPIAVQAATSEAHEELKKEIVAATSEEEKEIDITKELKEFVKNELNLEEKEPEQELKDIAIPIFTAEELAQKAKENGDTPDVVRDEVSKVVLFDYSDIIGGDEE